MFISIMVQIKFDRHIIYKMCVLDGVQSLECFVYLVIITFIVSSSSLLLRHDYIIKSLPGVKCYRDKFLQGK